MHENFVALDREKRDRIINAAMCEFAAKGYKNASTNEIVKKANISKGALFHYFASKRDVYEFLFCYSIDFFMESVEPHINEMPTDVFERWIEFAALKIEIAMQYPDMAGFIQNAFREDAEEVSGVLKKEYERFSVMFHNKIYEGIDSSKFKQDIDIAKALQMIWWVLEGFATMKQKEHFDITKNGAGDFPRTLFCEMESYLSLLKISLYKSEYLE